MYLDPQNGKEPMFKAAVRLLHNHGETLDPLQVLEVRNHSSPYVKKKLILLLILQLFQLLASCLMIELISGFICRNCLPICP